MKSRIRLPTLAILAFAITLAFPVASRASMITFDLDPFAGDPANVLVTVNKDGGLFIVQVDVIPEMATGNIGDITGIFFNATDTITEADITSTPDFIDFGTNTNKAIQIVRSFLAVFSFLNHCRSILMRQLLRRRILVQSDLRNQTVASHASG